ncbi:MAG TPA: glycerol-3-phosphate 1-O-acyltransferase PlsY [Candidatus Avamphibacillus intestinigallinarum]|nr:glycerol-3-phosphate 1-O-acyltransferase PlsY [Candidatus Avamphibacillus intestinigallinarum]
MYYILFAVIAYLLGSIPSALVVGKVGYNIDIRNYGSGNLGATNTFRVLGLKAGLIVTVSDILKGTVASLLPLIFQQTEIHILIIGLFAVLGHTYPIFARFKGGKAVATSAGVVLAASPILFGVLIGSFLLVLYISKYVSLASMVTGLITTIVCLFLDDWLLFSVILILTIFVFYRHKDNIKRILNKTEPKIKWM